MDLSAHARVENLCDSLLNLYVCSSLQIIPGRPESDWTHMCVLAGKCLNGSSFQAIYRIRELYNWELRLSRHDL